MADDERNVYLRKLHRIHRRRLDALEIKIATYGLECPTHILLETDDIREEIQRVENGIAGKLATGRLYRFLREIIGLNGEELHILQQQK